MTDILIVEDNKELAEVLGDFLRAEGYIVSTVLSAEHAVSMFERYGAKLVILDIMLPGADGFEALRRIRENDNTPVIIVSAKTEKDDKLNGLMLGADDYIEKPYDIDILMAKVRGIFKRRYQTDSIVCGDLTLDRIKCIAKRRTDCLILIQRNLRCFYIWWKTREGRSARTPYLIKYGALTARANSRPLRYI